MFLQNFKVHLFFKKSLNKVNLLLKITKDYTENIVFTEQNSRKFTELFRIKCETFRKNH